MLIHVIEKHIHIYNLALSVYASIYIIYILPLVQTILYLLKIPI